MSVLLFVFIPVWLAVAAWFVGAFARGFDRSWSTRIYAWAWWSGSIAMVVHIVGSYGLVHDWSHAQAVLQTAEESERVTGIRAGWGIYVNFCFAVVWMLYSIGLIRRGVTRVDLDQIVFWSTAAIVFMATVVFEDGPVRWAATVGFVSLAIAPLLRNRRRHG